MAGRRQHYLPQLLQRGFLDMGSRKAERSWLHRRSGPAQLVGIRDVGVSEYFYSRPVPGEVTLDDILTDLEGDLRQVVVNYRAATSGASVDAAVAARTVHHLITRTAHIRSLLANASTRFFERVETLFADPGRLAAMMGLGGVALSPLAVEEIEKAIPKLTSNGIPATLSQRLLAFYLREKGPGHFTETSGPMRKVLAELLPSIADQVREAHKAILAEDSAGRRWIERLAGFEWHVAHMNGLILPDAVGLASNGSGPLLPLLFTGGESTAVVVLPVATNRLLVGLRPGMAMIDLADFNVRAAACCENFFIAAESMDALGLAALIGTDTVSAIDATIADVLTSAGGGDLSAERGMATLGGTESNFSYSLRLDGFGDAALAENLNQVLNGVVAVLARRLPLGSLDGFTLAADYPAAVAALDRGGDLPRAASSVLGYGLGSAMTVAVIRGGEPKVHIIVASEIAQSWLDPDPAIRAMGLNVLVKMLAHVAHDYGYRDQRSVARFDPDLMTSILYPAIAEVPRSWYSARESAFLAPDMGAFHAELVLEALSFGREAMTEACLNYAKTDEVEPLVRTGLECSSAILAHAADWLGHRAGLAEEADYAGSNLPQRLAAWDLSDWIELYGRDLAAVYETADGRFDIARAISISSHVERLFWTMGLLAWPEGDTVRWLPFDPGQIPIE